MRAVIKRAVLPSGPGGSSTRRSDFDGVCRTVDGLNDQDAKITELKATVDRLNRELTETRDLLASARHQLARQPQPSDQPDQLTVRGHNLKGHDALTAGRRAEYTAH